MGKEAYRVRCETFQAVPAMYQIWQSVEVLDVRGEPEGVRFSGLPPCTEVHVRN